MFAVQCNWLDAGPSLSSLGKAKLQQYNPAFDSLAQGPD